MAGPPASPAQSRLTHSNRAWGPTGALRALTAGAVASKVKTRSLVYRFYMRRVIDDGLSLISH
jgi:hypothetical protein